MENYDSKSCSNLEKLYYHPIEAALRWCNLAGHESQILARTGAELLPPADAFPQWPCLRLNTEKIWAAIQDEELPYGRDGRSVVEGEAVRKDRMTVKHTDLRTWIQKTYPDQKPKFLFDEVERSTHPAINADTFRTLQADRDGLNARIIKAEAWAKTIMAEKSELTRRNDELAVQVTEMDPLDPRERTTFLNIIGGMLELIKSPRKGRDSDAAVIRELLENYGERQGIKKSTLESKFADANRSIKDA
jgi:hypothetical protein